LGKTTAKTGESREYIKVEDILRELKEFLLINKDKLANIKYITLSGSGEPTLNIKIADLIPAIKKITFLPIAVITNSSLLVDKGLRHGMLHADLILPSLDAATQDIFEKINQPAENLKIEDIIDALIELRKEFKGKIWLEIMLVKGVNDSPSQIKRLKEAVDRINPDKIQLNSPVRPPAQGWVAPLEQKELEKIKKIFGEKCEIV
jgi:wyosine [tRNA(Phe)-imidazoG37] synthetase (radical SAM superfamily)